MQLLWIDPVHYYLFIAFRHTHFLFVVLCFVAIRFQEAVWNQILDLDSYKGKVPKVSECKNYVAKLNEDGTSTMKTKMAVKVIPGYGVSRLFAPMKFILLNVIRVLSDDQQWKHLICFSFLPMLSPLLWRDVSVAWNEWKSYRHNFPHYYAEMCL